MSGHSKWATIKHKKGALDAKRGKAFTRLIKEITIAARQGGGDPDGNPRLRSAVAAAKAENMPADNIKRAIQRGTGELPGATYEEISFEGYGPGGVALIVEATTDNRNRAVSEIRHTFSKHGGNLGEPNSVRFMFSKKGIIAVAKDAATEEQLMNIVLEAGGEDLNDEGDTWEIITEPQSYDAVAQAVSALKLAGCNGPYALVLGADAYTAAGGGSDEGYPVFRHIEREVDGGVIWAPAIKGGFLVTTRGGDFELDIGQDVSIGYLSHSGTTVDLYLQETFTFQMLTSEAAVVLASSGK